ncbi:hypothetical protein NERG_00994 [Nematocida ausubeli]|uniref:Uncharacterized protein n=1 Tax=Nematocida ausubeli (strain ATCC PRA-371 / ERTm2) TaxID=1913371 RepID=H8ZBP5_NEMA1|nr:hypothetical protein NERG_00994 [Nematocida ausubeli]
MKDQDELTLPAKEYRKLEGLIEKVRKYVDIETKETKENLSLGTLDYLKKYRINR